MKAAVHSEFGGPGVLSLEEVAKPELGNLDILVRVRASQVTQGDRRLRAADYPGISKLIGWLMLGFRTPRHPVVGTNFAGEVVAVGRDVTRFAVGDDVFGGCDNSACAEYLAIGQDAAVATMPETLSYEQAAAAPYGAGTALTFLEDVAKVQPGERVLIIGASGGVGRFAVQLARQMGAEVTGVCSAEHFELVRDLGAEHVIDYRLEDYADSYITYDVILDTHSGGSFRHARSSLSPRGRFVTLHLGLAVLLQMALTSLLRGPRLLATVALANQSQMAAVAERLKKGAVQSVIAKRFELSEIAQAHAALEDRNPAGGVVVVIP